jgi:hypothetical protein
MLVALTTVTPVAAVPPRLTAAPVMKPVPVMVTAVPPLVVPVVGEIAVTVGAGLAGASGVLAMVVPPPQPGKKSASSNREQTGNQDWRDIKET